MRPLLYAIPALFLVAPVGAQDLQAYEPFDYGVTTGTGNINKQDGGAGWGPWFGFKTLPTRAGWWRLDDDVKDSSPTLNHGTLNGATYVADVPAAIKGHSSKSLLFNGTASDYVSLDAHVADYDFASVGTISAWFKTSHTTIGVILAASSSTQPSRELRLITESNGKLTYQVRGDMTLTLNKAGITSANVVNDGQWHHACVTVDRHLVTTLYLDGKPEGSKPHGFFASVVGTTVLDRMRIGHNVDSSGPSQWHYKGNIDDVAIWGEPLAASDVAALYTGRAPVAVFPKPETDGPLAKPESLATKNFLNTAFLSRGLAPVGNRMSDIGLAWRHFKNPIDMTTDGDDYLSFLIRREDKGPTPMAWGMRIRRVTWTRAWFGWDSTGMVQTGKGATTTTTQMLDKTTYFVVMRLRHKSGAQIDEVATKVYASTDTIHASDTLLAGAGTGANNWTGISQWTGSVAGILLDRIVLDPTGPDTIVDLDEMRVGKTWDSVTRVSYGQGCHAALIGQANTPRINSTNWDLTLRGAQRSQPALLILGLQKLGLDLTAAGAPGCFLNTSLDATFVTASDASGNASLTVPVPNDAKLIGGTAFWQWAGLDASANALGFRLSDGLGALFLR